MFIYAQLNEENICIGISQLSGEMNASNMVLLEEYDASIVGKKYEYGKWLEIPIIEVIEMPTEAEIIQAEMLLNQMQLIEQMNAIEMANAEILLNTLGGM